MRAKRCGRRTVPRSGRRPAAASIVALRRQLATRTPRSQGGNLPTMTTVASPLTDEKKRQVWQTVHYLAARLKGQKADPPIWWTAEQCAAFEAILSDPPVQSGILSWVLQGVR